ncbi:MAG: hypothetical protein ABIH29_02915 [Candidatus Micrarchaeota archaeon]
MTGRALRDGSADGAKGEKKVPLVRRWGPTGVAAGGVAVIAAALKFCGPAAEPAQDCTPTVQTQTKTVTKNVNVPIPCAENNLCTSAHEVDVIARGDGNSHCPNGTLEQGVELEILERRGKSPFSRANVLYSEFGNDGRLADGSKILLTERRWHVLFDEERGMQHIFNPCQADVPVREGRRRDEVSDEPTPVKAPPRAEQPPAKAPPAVSTDWRDLPSKAVPASLLSNLESLINGRGTQLKAKGISRVTVRFTIEGSGSISLQGLGGGDEITSVISRGEFSSRIGSASMSGDGTRYRYSASFPVQ